MGATTTRGGGGNDGSSSAWVRPQRSASRRPMVSTSGLTRSKGSVSQAGSTATGPVTAPRTAASSVPTRGSRHVRSSANRSASTPVAVTTTMGDLSVKTARAAISVD